MRGSKQIDTPAVPDCGHELGTPIQVISITSIPAGFCEYQVAGIAEAVNCGKRASIWLEVDLRLYAGGGL